MNTKKYNWILYLITTTIVVTIAVQLYWNYKNYQENKKRVANEIQISLDNAIEEYFSSLSKKSFLTIVNDDGKETKKWIQGNVKNRDSFGIKIRSIEFKTTFSDKYQKLPKLLDSVFQEKEFPSSTHNHSNTLVGRNNLSLQIFPQLAREDSARVARGFKSVFIALTNDTINFSALDSIFSKQLKKKGIESSFYFHYSDRDSLLVSTKKEQDSKLFLFADAKSTYLRKTQQLKVFHTDPTISALKRSSTGILLSFLLSLTVISSLFYLLKIIQKQKELAEVKNDLISNITHEFKTPIATVSTAIEAIENFNAIDDKEKTQKYLSMSSIQLKKLHQMVEKLLETATLDSENLILKKEEIDIVDLVSKIVNKHLVLTDKKINFSTNIDSKMLFIDGFHFENAISNLIDNAVKYGGNTIEVNINAVLNNTQISIADDGKGIEKSQQEKIFDKFYRIPKGNRHDVKGFGIGLYYTKKIVEKHLGEIHLSSTIQNTIFKINFPK